MYHNWLSLSPNFGCNCRVVTVCFVSWFVDSAMSHSSVTYNAFPPWKFDVFHARLPRQGMVKFYKGSILSSRRHNLPSEVKLCKLYGTSIHVDATVMQSFQTKQFSRFLPSPYGGHNKLAVAKHWRWVPK